MFKPIGQFQQLLLALQLFLLSEASKSYISQEKLVVIIINGNCLRQILLMLDLQTEPELGLTETIAELGQTETIVGNPLCGIELCRVVTSQNFISVLRNRKVNLAF